MSRRYAAKDRRHAAGAAVMLGCAAIALGLLAGCGTTSAHVVLHHDPQADVIVTSIQQAGLQSAKFTTAEQARTAQGVMVTTSTGEMSLNPFNVEVKTDARLAGQDQKSTEIIASQLAYVQTDAKPGWQQIVYEPAARQNMSIITLQNLPSVPTLSFIGAEKLNGTSVDHLRASMTAAQSAAGLGYTEDLWVNARTYLPVKVSIVSDASTDKQHGKLTSTTTYSAWNAPVQIQAPAADQIQA